MSVQQRAPRIFEPVLSWLSSHCHAGMDLVHCGCGHDEALDDDAGRGAIDLLIDVEGHTNASAGHFLDGMHPGNKDIRDDGRFDKRRNSLRFLGHGAHSLRHDVPRKDFGTWCALTTTGHPAAVCRENYSRASEQSPIATSDNLKLAVGWRAA